MSLQGLDVSDDQGVIRWPNVAAAGYSFGIAKASEGVGFTTWSFGGNWKGMQSAGLVRGAYHFSRVANDPQIEADFFLSAVGPLAAGDLLALDLEDERAVGDISGYALAFLDECYRQTGVRPFWYSYPYYIENHGLARLFDSAYPAWLVNPLSGWPDTLLQLLNGGFIDGIQGPVDLDDFFGTETQLLAYGKGGTFSNPVVTLPTFSQGGSDSGMVILPHPTAAGRFDAFIVGVDLSVYHDSGALLDLGKAWNRIAGVAGTCAPGTLSVGWNPDGSLLVSVLGPTGRPNVKVLNGDLTLNTDWTTLGGTGALPGGAKGDPGKDGTPGPKGDQGDAGPEGKQGPPGTLAPHSHPVSLTGSTGLV